MKVNMLKYTGSFILIVLVSISISHWATASEIMIIPSPPLPVAPVNPKYTVDVLSGDGLVTVGILKNYLGSEDEIGNWDYISLFRWTKQNGFESIFEHIGISDFDYRVAELSFFGTGAGYEHDFLTMAGIYYNSFIIPRPFSNQNNPIGVQWLKDLPDYEKLDAPNKASDISSDGMMLAGWWGDYYDGWDGIFTWGEGFGPTKIPPPENCEFDDPDGPVVSGDYRIIANCQEIDSGSDYFVRWTESGGYERLGNGTAADISTDGVVIVGTTPEGRAFRYTDLNGMEEIGDFSPVKTNGDGSIVIGDNRIWEQNYGLQSIWDYLIRKGVDLDSDGWIIDSVKDMSDDGSVFIGTGRNNSTAEARPWIATVITPSIDENIADNRAERFSKVGTWHASDKAPGFYGRDYVYAYSGDGSAAATFTFEVPLDGNYQIAAQWPAHSSRAPDAPFTLINNDEVVDTVRVDQRINGGRLNLLAGPASGGMGIYWLHAGVLKVTLSNNAAGKVAADAVRVVSAGTVIVDSADDAFSTAGIWIFSNKDAGFYGPDYAYSLNGPRFDTATFTFQIPADGKYEISAQWPANSSLALYARFDLVNNAEGVGVVYVDQRMNGGQFNRLKGLASFGTGIYTLSAGELQVILTNSDTRGSVAADAVRVVKLSDKVIIDNRDARFSKVGDWHAADKAPGFFGTDYVYAFGGDGSAAATFTFEIPFDGNYQIAAQWPAHSSRAPDAPFALTNNGTVVDTVQVDQRIDGGRFNPLAGPVSGGTGIYTLGAGVLEVTLSNDAAGKVAADAVQMVNMGPATP